MKGIALAIVFVGLVFAAIEINARQPDQAKMTWFATGIFLVVTVIFIGLGW